MRVEATTISEPSLTTANGYPLAVQYVRVQHSRGSAATGKIKLHGGSDSSDVSFPGD